MNTLAKHFPKIGERTNEFINAFGQPTVKKGNETLITIDTKVKNASYLSLGYVNNYVRNISYSSPVSLPEAESIARKFLPFDSSQVSRKEGVISEPINADVPVNILVFYSKGLLDNEGYLNSEKDRGYVTVFVSNYGDTVNFTVALGREALILE